MGGVQLDQGCLAAVECLLPPESAETPVVSGVESGEGPSRGGKVVALGLGEGQELEQSKVFMASDLQELFKMIESYPSEGKVGNEPDE